MNDRIKLTPFERKIAAGGGQAPPCPEPEEYLDLMEQGDGHPNAIGLLEHAAECADCRELYLGVQETWQATHAVMPIDQAERRPTLWQRIFGPSLGFTAGAAATAAILLLIAMPAQVNERLQQQRSRLIADSDREIARLKNQPPIVLTLGAAIRRAEKSGLQLQTVEPGDSKQRGEGGADLPPLHLEYPVSQAVLDARPVFRWQAVKGATYQIRIINPGTVDTLAQATAINATEWRPSKDLIRDLDLEWTVTAMKDGRPVSEKSARFRIIEAKRAAQLMKEEQDALLARGVAMAQAGVLDEAEKAFHEVLRTDPGNKDAAKWLKELRSKWTSARK